MFLCSTRDGEDLDSQGDGSSQPDTISIASRTSQNTLDSDKVSCQRHCPFQLVYIQSMFLASKDKYQVLGVVSGFMAGIKNKSGLGVGNIGGEVLCDQM